MLLVGQVLKLKIRLNNSGYISHCEHPYLIYKVDEERKIIEVIQLDSQKGKEKHLRHPANHPIAIDGPWETVITESSYARCNSKYTFELFDEIERAKETEDTLSSGKLTYLIEHYEFMQNKPERLISDNIVYQSKEELIKLNPKLLH